MPFLILLTGLAFWAGVAIKPADASDMAACSRTFELVCTVSVPMVPAGIKRLDVWVPVPSCDSQQSIEAMRIDSSLQHELQPEGEYGNRVLHLWSDKPGPVFATVSFRCTRRQERAIPLESRSNVSCAPKPSQRLLAPDRLGVIDDHIRSLARQITDGKPDSLSKARAIYDYVVSHMTYDKTAPGWGNGDTHRACNVRKGNCTDFHALFISLTRAAGIPCRFGIGFQIPSEAKQGPVAGYHCWAEFWLPGTGWVPVDCSEAWKHANKREFYFGNLDDNRIRISLGRDIALPGMHGQPLNYFAFAYAEADGKRVKVEQRISEKAD